MKRLLSFLLILAIIMSFAPAAFADGDDAENSPEYSDGYSNEVVQPSTAPVDGESDTLSAHEEWTNPIYESIDFSACQSAPVTYSLFGAAHGVYGAEYYTTVDAAAAHVRSIMSARSQTSFTVYFRTTDTAFTGGGSSAETYARTKSREIMDAAMEHTGVSYEGDAIAYDIPGWTCSIGSDSVSGGRMSFAYTVTSPSNPSAVGYYSNAAQEQQVRSEVTAKLATLALTGKSDFEKVRAIYSFICSTVSYDSSNPDTYMLKYTAYAALINHNAVCQGFAALFYRMALESGVDTRIIGSQSAAHAWNIVKLGSVYYNIDATWDINYNATGNWQWFLQCPSRFQRGGAHPVEDDYATAEFISAYPMSGTDYVGETTVTLDMTGLEQYGDGAVFIDGVEYTLSGGSVTLPDPAARSAVIYSYNSTTATDRHTVYPTDMFVWKLSYQNGAYSAERLAGFDNIMRYAGSAIRIVGKKGIRIITSVPSETKALLTGAGTNGYKLREYGTIAVWANTQGGTDTLVYGGTGVKGNYAYNKTLGLDPIYKQGDGLIKFTNVLTFKETEMDKCVPDLALRPYMILEDADGVYTILYGGTVYRNIGYVAYQNRAVFDAGTAAYDYIWGIINYVYPQGYTP